MVNAPVYSDPDRIAKNLLGTIDDLSGQRHRDNWHCGAVSSTDPILSGDGLPDYGPSLFTMEATNREVAVSAVSVLVNSGVKGGLKAAADATHVYIMPIEPGFDDWLRRRNLMARGSASTSGTSQHRATSASDLVTGSNPDTFRHDG